jgi:hypothetical protein
MVNRQLFYCYEYVLRDAYTLYIAFKIIMITLIVLCLIFSDLMMDKRQHYRFHALRG